MRPKMHIYDRKPFYCVITIIYNLKSIININNI